MNNFTLHKVTLAVLVSILVCGIASVGSGPLLAQSVLLPPETRVPYEGTKRYTGGPHSLGDFCEEVAAKDTSGIDFAGGTFEVLSIADGEFLGWGQRGAPGRYVLIEHANGIQSMYWHLASISPEILALTPGDPIPQGFFIGMSGLSGGQDAIHLHLELRTGANADDPLSGEPVTWDGQTIDGWTIRTFRSPDEDGVAINYRGSAVRGASETRSITNVTCSSFTGRTTADAIVSESYPADTIASNNLDANTGFANFTEDANFCQAVDCKELESSNRRNEVDVFFLVDLSGSFSDDLSVFKAEAPGIISTYKAENPNTRFGLGKFEDYPIPPFGSASAGDKAYELVLDLTSDTDAVLTAIAGLSTLDGGDEPQSHLTALFQAATGAGQDLSGEGFPDASIPAGQQVNFRDGATKLFVLQTDAPFHEPGDPGDIPYPGPSFLETIEAIEALDPPKVIGISSGGGGIADLERIAEATGALAPPDGVDCDADGTIDIPAGEPLVCSIAESGEGIAEATLALIEAGAVPPPAPEEPEEPEERACTLDAQAGRIIVEFPEDVVLTTRKQSDNSFGPLAVDIPSGAYHITLVSFDDHIEHPEEEDQTQESWFLQAENEEGDIFFESNPISDLPTAQNILEEHVEEHVEITEDITGLSAKHVLDVGESDTAESIWPVCAAFDEVEENNQD